MRLNKGVYYGEGICGYMRVYVGICGYMHLSAGKCGFKSLESGIRVQGALCSLIDNFTVLLFYFFKKKKYWNIGTFR